jgi:hypothetical protein
LLFNTGQLFAYIFKAIKSSQLAKILLLIVFLKILIFYGFLKGFLFPRYLKPKWESDEHRSNEVMKDLLNKPKTFFYVRFY